jgi:hypothetical protein
MGYAFGHRFELFEGGEGRSGVREGNSMMHEERLQELVARVIERLAERLGASGENGCLMVVFTAATVAFSEALQQVRNLICNGFRVQLVFSEAAKQLLSKAVLEQLAGFPHVATLEPAFWLGALNEARAVVVPLLSLNTLSKLSLLIADNPAANIVLHGLLMGKPVVVARNGADPGAEGRRELGFHRGRPVMARAMAQRLHAVADFGCTVTDVRELAETVNSLLLHQDALGQETRERSAAPPGPAAGGAKHFITAAEVLHARRAGTALHLGTAAGMTPLAREMAMRYGVLLTTDVLD